MTADLTREQAREQIARAIYCAYRSDLTPEDVASTWGRFSSPLRDDAEFDTDLALTVLWPVVEGLRAERDAARRMLGESKVDRGEDVGRRVLDESIALSGALLRGYREAHDAIQVENARLRAELAHAHTVIARHVEPRREGEP